MNKKEIQKLFKDNPIKVIKYGDIEIPVEWLKQTTVNINGDDYIKLQQENQHLKEKLKIKQEVIEEVRKTLKLERKTALSLNQAYTVSVIDSVLQILDKGESDE